MRQRTQTYALTVVCAERMRLLQRSANAELFVRTIFRYQDEGRFALHGFVAMPDHVHLLLSPVASLEATVGLIKGGFSFAVRKQYSGPVWQDGYYSHRVLTEDDFTGQLGYIATNPERRQYVDYPYVHTRFVDRLSLRPLHLGG